MIESKNVIFKVIFVLMFVSVSIGGVTWGPYLTCPDTSGAVVQFGKLLTDIVMFEWGDSSDYDRYGFLPNRTINSSLNEILSFQIDDCFANSRIYYRIHAGDEISKLFSFITMPSPDECVRFIAYGDTRSNEMKHRQICSLMVSYEPAFVTHSGDLNCSMRGDWQMFFRGCSPISSSAPFVNTIGNHDFPLETYKAVFHLPGNEEYYAITAGAVTILNVNIYSPIYPGSPQYNWFESYLTDSISSGNKWTIVNLHEPLYSTGGHGPNLYIREILKPLLDVTGVNMVLAGHNHCYEHCFVDGIHYITTGGGGAPLYSVRGDEFTVYGEGSYHFLYITADDETMAVEVIRDDGSLMEYFVLGEISAGIDDEEPDICPNLVIYPNPFNSKTTISVSSSSKDFPSMGLLLVHDVSGRRVDKILWEENSSVNWSPNLKSGVYLLSLQHGKNKVTKRVVLAK